MSGIVVRSLLWPEEHLRETQERPIWVGEMGHEFSGRHPALLLEHGGSLLYASTQPKKLHDSVKIFSSLGVDIEVGDPLPILSWFLAADEKSRSFIGNAYEKAQSILNRVYDTLGYEKVIANMRKQGMDPEKVIICVNDCGAYFNTDYSSEPEFSHCLDEKGLGPWPGVEFSPVTDAQGGLVRFFSALDAMRHRKEAVGEHVDLTGYDHQTYLFFKLAPRREDVRFFSFEASVPIKFVTRPVPFDVDVLTSFHFTQTDDDNLPDKYRGKTRAEYEEVYLNHYSAESAALRAFVRHAEIPKKSLSRRFQYHAPLRMSYSYGSQHNVPSKRRSDRYEHFTIRNDAIILGRHDKSITDNWDDNFADLFDLWCSLIVNKQVRVEEFEGVPFAVVNRKNQYTWKGRQNGALNWNDPVMERDFVRFMSEIDPVRDPWLQFMLFTQYLHEKGFVKQEPRFLYNHFDSADSAMWAFLQNEVTKNSRKKHVEKYEAEEFGRDVRDRFELTILGSASTRVPGYKEDAFEIGYWAAKRGWHVRTGGGRYGIMGSTADGVFEYMRHRPSSRWRNHFSAIQMPRTLQFEGSSLDPLALQEAIREKGWVNKYLRVEPNFGRRINNLGRSHVIGVHGAAGIGTYQEIIRLMGQGKQLIVLNPQQPDRPEGIRVMDPFFAILPKSLHKHITVVNDIYGFKAETLKAHDKYIASLESRPPEYHI